jgi:hypothetical protein
MVMPVLSLVGSPPGVAEGVEDATALAAADATAVGLAVGLGVAVGAGVGFVVGLAVGFVVGLAVGFGVGVGFGLAVTEGAGEAVGTGVFDGPGDRAGSDGSERLGRFDPSPDGRLTPPQPDRSTATSAIAPSGPGRRARWRSSVNVGGVSYRRIGPPSIARLRDSRSVEDHRPADGIDRVDDIPGRNGVCLRRARRASAPLTRKACRVGRPFVASLVEEVGHDLRARARRSAAPSHP